jgi:hypothetical protein
MIISTDYIIGSIFEAGKLKYPKKKLNGMVNNVIFSFISPVIT